MRHNYQAVRKHTYFFKRKIGDKLVGYDREMNKNSINGSVKIEHESNVLRGPI